MKPTLLRAALALLVLAGGMRLAAAASLKFVTWNLEWLTDRPAGSSSLPADVRPKRPADIARLRAYAAEMNADVIAIQEVDGAHMAAQVFPPDRYVIHMTHDPVVQRVGIAVRRGIPFTVNPDDTALALPHSWLRSGADITLHLPSGPLRVLAVHLKAGCQFSPLRSHRRACEVLAHQVPALVAWIHARAQAGMPFVVLGDFNRWMDRRDGRPDGLWTRLQAAAPLVRATAGFASPCLGGERFIDHIIAGGAARGWLEPKTLRVLVFREHGRAWEKRLSDHCPVSVRFRLPG
ncbi:MAG: endonuclease/exonuclease/phosphatase family protein [Acetobacteraceae bacterium]